MTDKKYQKSEEQQKKETKRNFFYDLAKDEHLQNVFSTYLASDFYGNEGKNVLGRHLYKDSLWKAEGSDENGKRYNLAQNELEQSRKDGEVGTGTLYEENIMKKAGQEIQNSLKNLYVEDIFALTGNKDAAKKLKKDYQGKTLEDLQPSEKEMNEYQQMKENLKQMKGKDKEDAEGKLMVKENKIKKQMQLYEQIVGQYQKYMVDTKMREALGKEKKEPGKNLESMLCESE